MTLALAPTLKPNAEPNLEPALEPAPAQASNPAAPSTPNPARTRAALRRCTNAWRRSFNAYMESSDGDRFDRILAARQAADAFCAAMPLLCGRESINDFIACATQGILIGAIEHRKGSQLLHAAQTTLKALGSLPKPTRAV